MADALLCRGMGHCQPIDNCGGCFGDSVGCRTCGCDGNTYPDPQTACLAGVNAVYTGAACGETIMGGVAGSSGMVEGPLIPCGTDAQCPSGRFCCALVGLCYEDVDRDICIPPPEDGRVACKTNGHCAQGEYCLGEGCESIGGCVPNPGTADCGVTIEPVCGCDGTSYTSPECAASRGVRVDHADECADK
jgi:hypothetical protein